MMEPVRLIQVKEEIHADNQAVAAALRRRLAHTNTFLLNLMSAPGAGKTQKGREIRSPSAAMIQCRRWSRAGSTCPSNTR